MPVWLAARRMRWSSGTSASRNSSVACRRSNSWRVRPVRRSAITLALTSLSESGSKRNRASPDSSDSARARSSGLYWFMWGSGICRAIDGDRYQEMHTLSTGYTRKVRETTSDSDGRGTIAKTAHAMQKDRIAEHPHTSRGEATLLPQDSDSWPPHDAFALRFS